MQSFQKIQNPLNRSVAAVRTASGIRSGSNRRISRTPVRMGVEIQTISPGDGKNFPQSGQTVSVHYVGTLQDGGSKFDSSRDRGKPFEFPLGQGRVIKAWDEGIAQLSLGQKANLIASPDYAYGARGFPPVIPPNSTLVFEVELLSFK